MQSAASPSLDEQLATQRPLGRVAAPPFKESTSDYFYFWVERDRLVERSQIVRTTSQLGGHPVEFIALVEEAYRQSRQHDMGEEVDRYDSDATVNPPFASAGFTYARAIILRTDPLTYAPPTEESPVYLGGAREAEKGYGLDRMKENHKLRVGLLRNGGTAFAGPAIIDLAYLLGENGGHLNVNGIAGLGAKSSFLLHVNWLLLREAQRQKEELPSAADRLQIVPIVFNVKNYDLFFIDKWSKDWRLKEADARPEWQALGIEAPAPFTNVQYFAPQQKNLTTPVPVGRTTDVAPYSWSLSDIIGNGLFRFLFAEDDLYDANFGGLVGELEDWLTSGPPGEPRLRADAPQTFADLVDWFRETIDQKEQFKDFVSGTKRKLLRQLKHAVYEGDGVLRRNDARGNPLELPNAGVEGPIVIDLFGLRMTPSLQRFVVAAVFHQLILNRSGNKMAGLRYVVTLDELNRFAPKNSSDPITQKIEEVAAEMRSQGVILLGAQQQASKVATRVIENSAVRAIGRSGTLELSAEVWKGISDTARSQAAQLQADEKLLLLPSFRAPMLMKIPYPPWALKQEDVDVRPDNRAEGAPKKSRREADFA